jgi:hypothetical protein
MEPHPVVLMPMECYGSVTGWCKLYTDDGAGPVYAIVVDPKPYHLDRRQEHAVAIYLDRDSGRFACVPISELRVRERQA